MNEIPDHIKFIYIMVLKHNVSVKELSTRTIFTWEALHSISNLSVDYALEIEDTVNNFINKYMIL